MPTLTRDGDKSDESRWSCMGDLVKDGANCEITYGFEDPQDIAKMRIAFYTGDQPFPKLRVMVNGDFLVTVEPKGETTDFQNFLLGSSGVSIISLEAVDLDGDDWVGLTEVKNNYDA